MGADAVTTASEILPNGDRATDGKKRLGNVFNPFGLFLQPLNSGAVKDYQQTIEACSQKNTVEQKLKQPSFYYRSNHCLVEDYFTMSQTVPRFVIVTCEE